MAPSFTVNCVGHTSQRGHVEYVFRVYHQSGCEWTVQRRYQELKILHEKLGAVFGVESIPAFPPGIAGSSPTAVVGSIFGQSIGRRPEVVASRETAFQRYFTTLCSREDIVKTTCFQTALAVAAPEPVVSIRVQSWLPCRSGGPNRASVVLGIRPEPPVPETSSIAECFHVAARLIVVDASYRRDAVLAAVDVPAAGASRDVVTARLDGLPREEQVELEVTVTNSVAGSAPVVIRVLAPTMPDTRRTPGELDPHTPRGTSLLRFRSMPSPRAQEPLAAKFARDEAEDTRTSSLLSIPEAERRRNSNPQWSELRAERESLGEMRAQLAAQLADLQRQREEHDAAQATAAEQRESSKPEEGSPSHQRPADYGLEVNDQLGGGTLGSPEQSAMEDRVRALQAELCSQHNELERHRTEEEERRREREIEVEQQSQELRARMETLESKEEALQDERDELHQKRRSLAVVQAHVISMMDKAQPGGPAQTVRLDATPRRPEDGEQKAEWDDAEDDEGSESFDRGVSGTAPDVWDMDWTTASVCTSAAEVDSAALE